MIQRLSNATRIFAKARSGISAVEFALIAPLMAVIYIGCIELSMMMSLDRKVTNASASLGDLTARASAITNDDLDDIFEATRMIFQPNDIKVARMRISSLREDGGKVKVAWSDACNLTAYNVDDELTIPNNLIPTDGTIIYAEIEYDYSAVMGYFFSAGKTLTDKFYLRPRRVDSITRDRSDGAYTCKVVQ